MKTIAINIDEIEDARQRVTKARENFDKIRDDKKVDEYEKSFQFLLSELDYYHAIRRRIITQLNLEIM